MSKTMVPIPAGSMVVITEGAYSDYTVQNLYRAKVDIDANAMLRDYLIEHPDQRSDYTFDNDKFMAWLATKDLLEPLPYYEWHLTDYSSAEEMDVIKPEG